MVTEHNLGSEDLQRGFSVRVQKPRTAGVAWLGERKGGGWGGRGYCGEEPKETFGGSD